MPERGGGVTLMGQRRMQVKRLIIQPVGNQLLLFKKIKIKIKKQSWLKVDGNVGFSLQPVTARLYVCWIIHRVYR